MRLRRQGPRRRQYFFSCRSLADEWFARHSAGPVPSVTSKRPLPGETRGLDWPFDRVTILTAAASMGLAVMLGLLFAVPSDDDQGPGPATPGSRPSGAEQVCDTRSSSESTLRSLEASGDLSASELDEGLRELQMLCD